MGQGCSGAHRYLQDGSAEALKELDESISKVNAEIEHMAPNLKAMDRSVFVMERGRSIIFIQPLLQAG